MGCGTPHTCWRRTCQALGQQWWQVALHVLLPAGCLCSSGSELQPWCLLYSWKDLWKLENRRDKSQGLGWSVHWGLQGGHLDPGNRHPLTKTPTTKASCRESLALWRGRGWRAKGQGWDLAGWRGRPVYTKGHTALGRVCRWQLVGSPFTGRRCPDPHRDPTRSPVTLPNFLSTESIVWRPCSPPSCKVQFIKENLLLTVDHARHGSNT